MQRRHVSWPRQSTLHRIMMFSHPPLHTAAMTMFYMAVSIALVLAWMVWRRYLWADQYFM